MADDSLEILEEHPFHPTDPPYGMEHYDLGTLTKDQQRTLNLKKMKQRKDNEQYFKAHPEIKGLISILLSHILQTKPIVDLHEAAGEFFSRPRHKIVAELLDYLSESGCTGSIIDNLRKDLSNSEWEDSTDTENGVPCV
ncbi:uncharacterized protein LOC107263545 [Cephus cinctus]|uniref:Uncharacterized protein LOC107263545 n=1 Tax=Cephus cinctus TaxID=211228 RepID=A0AAJ7FDG4_CEPCN|nr:uncharacterized protein LOC107263545 [Cephus cinctus]